MHVPRHRKRIARRFSCPACHQVGARRLTRSLGAIGRNEMKYIYIIEKVSKKRFVLVGVWSDRKRAVEFLKNASMSFSYILTKVPVNRNVSFGKDFEDNMGAYDHWHFGKNSVLDGIVSKNGSIKKRRRVMTIRPK